MKILSGKYFSRVFLLRSSRTWANVQSSTAVQTIQIRHVFWNRTPDRHARCESEASGGEGTAITFPPFISVFVRNIWAGIQSARGTTRGREVLLFLWVGKTTPSLLPQLDLLVSWTTIVLSCVRLCSVILLRVHVGASHSGCRPEMLRRKGHQTDARCQNAKRGEEKRLGLSRPISPG